MVLCIAEGTAKVAAAEAHEDGGRSAMVTFTLKGIEYFVYFVHRLRDFGTSGLRDDNSQSRSHVVPRQLIKVLWRVVLDVGSLVVARLPHIGTVAVRDGIHNPLGQVLGRRVEVQHLVDIGVVDLAVNQALNLGEVAHHAIAVELFGTAIHIDLPVVAMQVLAFALIVEIKLVTCGYF